MARGRGGGGAYEGRVGWGVLLAVCAVWVGE